MTPPECFLGDSDEASNTAMTDVPVLEVLRLTTYAWGGGSGRL